MTDFTDHCVGPVDSSHPPKSLVIFLHGYGSSGKEMARYMGPILSPMLPKSKLVFMTGPDFLGDDKEGKSCYSWFKADDMLNSPIKAVAAERAMQVIGSINAQIDAIIKREGMKDCQVVIAGFSQGATMAVYAGLMRDKPVAAVHSLSGGALDQVQTPKSKPPVFCVVGALERHEYNGEEHVKTALQQLNKDGFYTESYTIPDHEHDISKEAMRLISIAVDYALSHKFRLKHHFAKPHKKHKAHKKPHQPRRRSPGNNK